MRGNLGNLGNLTPNPQQNRLFPSRFNIATLATLATLPQAASRCFYFAFAWLILDIPMPFPQDAHVPSTPL